MLLTWFPILVTLAVAALVVGGMVTINRLTGPRHPTKIKGEAKYNPEFGKNLNGGTEENFPVAYQKSPISIACDKHQWMGAVLITFDHPFFAVTDKDGHFEIKNVPSDVELTVKMWHEVAKPESSTKTFKKGDNTLDLKVKGG